MIEIFEGDILQAEEDIIVQQVNAQGVMGSGLAKQIRAKWPRVYDDYKGLCNRENPYDLMGEAQIVRVEKAKYVANLFGQLNYGRKKVRYTDYDALFKGLKYIKDLAKKNGKSVAIPYNIGCGLANGDWGKVYGMIEEIFKRYEVTLYKYNG